MGLQHDDDMMLFCTVYSCQNDKLHVMYLQGMQSSIEKEVLPAGQALPQQVMLRADPNEP